MIFDGEVETVLDARIPTGLGGRWHGVFPALVLDNQDPDGQGRVKVSLPWSPDTGGAQYAAWARIATMMAGKNRGSWFIPDVGDEVLVAFEGGDPRRPYMLGGLWNGTDNPPQSMDGNNTKKVLRSRNGVKITLDDTDGSETLILETPAGQKVTLTDSPASVEVDDSNGNTLRMDASGVTVTSSGQVVVNASSAEITAGTLTVNAGQSTFSGAVTCDTLIASSVVGASYTPGAGNIW